MSANRDKVIIRLLILLAVQKYSNSKEKLNRFSPFGKINNHIEHISLRNLLTVSLTFHFGVIVMEYEQPINQ
jgi:hypothetical protein